MEEYLKYITFHKTSTLGSTNMKKIESIPGIVKVQYINNEINITYNYYVIDENWLTDNLKDLGFIPVSDKRNRFSRWLAKLAKTNKQTMGSNRLDCCDMNHKKEVLK